MAENLDIICRTADEQWARRNLLDLIWARSPRRQNTVSVAPVAPVFTPIGISSLRLWLETDSLSLSDGDLTGTWADQSGYGNDVTSSGSNRPTFKSAILNGLPILRFNGSQWFTRSTAVLPSLTEFTMMAVCRTSNVSASDQTVVICGSAEDTGLGLAISAHGSTISLLYPSVGWMSTTTTPIGNQWYILTAVRVGGIATVYDGSTPLSPTFSATPLDPSAATTIGGNEPWGGMLVGDIAAILAFDSGLGSTDLTNLVNYLKGKYGL